MNLSSGGKFKLDDIPIKKFYDQAQYLENEILPKIKDPGQLQTFQDIYKSLLYAVMIVDRGNHLILKLQQINQLNNINYEGRLLAERELLKYTTMEDIIMTDGMDKIAAAVKTRIENMLNK